MPTGDYIACPLCGHSMIYGSGAVCSDCSTKAGFPPKQWTSFASVKSDDEKSLNELVDDTLGETRPTKKVPKSPLNESLADDFEKFFKEPTYSLPSGGVWDKRPPEKVSIKKINSTADLNAAFEAAFNTGFEQAFGATKPQPRKTLVVNIFSGPGAGKSTMCAGIFSDLKHQGVECEMALEYAKDLVWQKRNFTFEDQLYLFAKQHHRIFCLLGQVDVVITDCPILLSPVYDGHNRKTLEKLIVEEHNKMWTYNVFLKRKKKYNPNGRIHNEAQAHTIDRKTLDVLDRNGIPYETADPSNEGRNKLVHKINMLRAYGSIPKINI